MLFIIDVHNIGMLECSIFSWSLIYPIDLGGRVSFTVFVCASGHRVARVVAPKKAKLKEAEAELKVAMDVCACVCVCVGGSVCVCVCLCVMSVECDILCMCVNFGCCVCVCVCVGDLYPLCMLLILTFFPHDTLCVCVCVVQSLNKKRADLRAVQQKLADLQAQFDENMAKKEQLERDVDICTKKLDR